MKPLIIVFCLVVLTTLQVRSVSACMCSEVKNTTIVSVGLPPTPDEIRRWRTEQTDYALFTGRVLKIETVRVKRAQGSGDKVTRKKVTVAIQSYWLGVNAAEFVIYTSMGDGDCGVRYAKGAQYFFWAARFPRTGLLETNICGPTTIDPKLLADLDEVFGRAKSFS